MKSIEIDTELYERIHQLSNEYNKSINDIVKLILKGFLRRNKHLMQNTDNKQEVIRKVHSYKDLESILKDLG